MNNELSIKIMVLNIVSGMELPNGTEPHDMALWMYDWLMDSVPEDKSAEVINLQPVVKLRRLT